MADVPHPLGSPTLPGLSYQLLTSRKLQLDWQSQSQSQSQSYFTTGGLPPISSSWCKDPQDSRPSMFFQLNPCSHSPYVTSSFTRGWVCHLQLLLAFASAVILGSESRGTHEHILLSQIRDSPNLEGQVPAFITHRNRVARIYPQALGSLFVAS
jgi:hypothetical protein